MSEPSALPLTQYERLLKIEERLRSAPPPGREELAGMLEVTVRTLQRDLVYLRDRMGAPLEFDHRQRGYVLTEESWFLPQVALTEGELFGLLVARQAVAQYRGTPAEKTLLRIFDKMAGSLKDQISLHPDYPRDGILSFAPSMVLPVNEQVWSTVLEAARKKHKVKIDYRSARSGKTGRRTLDPYHVINMQGDWYLYAWDEGHGKVCQFQLHRILKAVPLGISFEPDSGFDLERVVNSSFGNFGSDEDLVQVRLRIRGHMALLLTERRFHPAQKVEEIKDGFEIRFPVSAAGDRPFFHLQQWILSMGSEVEVLEPGELREQLRKEVKKMQRNFSK